MASKGDEGESHGWTLESLSQILIVSKMNHFTLGLDECSTAFHVYFSILCCACFPRIVTVEVRHQPCTLGTSNHARATKPDLTSCTIDEMPLTPSCT